MKITITLDPAVVLHYRLTEHQERLKAGVSLAAEQLVKRQESDASLYGKLLFNRPGAISVNIE